MGSAATGAGGRGWPGARAPRPRGHGSGGPGAGVAGAAGSWFEARAAGVGLRVERDPAGNRWAVPLSDGPWWATGSHTDTVRQGGRFDGALGVAAGFAVLACVDAPIAVISFADEEGARFN